MYVSMKTYNIGVFSTLLSIIICLVRSPKLFNFEKIGTPEYPMSLYAFTTCIITGSFSYISQDAMSIALGIVKSATVTGFFNLSMVISFIGDAIFFGRIFMWSDYVGAFVIIACTYL